LSTPFQVFPSSAAGEFLSCEMPFSECQVFPLFKKRTFCSPCARLTFFPVATWRLGRGWSGSASRRLTANLRLFDVLSYGSSALLITLFHRPTFSPLGTPLNPSASFLFFLRVRYAGPGVPLLTTPPPPKQRGVFSPWTKTAAGEADIPPFRQPASRGKRPLCLLMRRPTVLVLF